MRFGKLWLDVRLMLAQRGRALVLVVGTFAYQRSEGTQVRQGHAGGAKPGADVQPVHIVLTMDASTAARAANRREQRVLLFVEAQGVHAQAGPGRHVAGAHRCVGRFSLVAHGDAQTECDQDRPGDPFEPAPDLGLAEPGSRAGDAAGQDQVQGDLDRHLDECQ